MSRCRWCTVLVVALFVGMQSSCASGGPVVTRFNTQSLRDSIVNSLPSDTEFSADPADGDFKKVAGWFILPDIHGTLQPHTQSIVGPLRHRKVLARIMVTRKYRDLAPTPKGAAPVWNYWLVGQTDQGQWVSIYVAPTVAGHIAVRELTPASVPHNHSKAFAKWRFSTAAPWATCTDSGCCCEDSHCRTPEF